MNIEFKKDAVCFANGKQWFVYKEIQLALRDGSGKAKHMYNLMALDDFQLNEPRIGDYIPKSELDTEQKYNDAVEVFGLFGYLNSLCFPHYSFKEFSSSNFDCLAIYKHHGDEKMISLNMNDSAKKLNAKLTYNQLMATGKLKRLMNERKSSAVSKVNLDIERAVKSKINDEPDKPMDNVKSPSHYQLIEGVESIEIIARSMTQEQWKGFCLGNMLKYRIRAGKKDALQQDIEKANFYGELYEMHKEKCYG